LRPQKQTVVILYLVGLGIPGFMTHAGSEIE